MDSSADILPSTHITDSLLNHISPPACHNVAALKLGTPREPLTIWGENIVVQWVDKDYQGQLDSFFLDEAIAKLISKGPFMNWSGAWDCTIYLTICPSQPLMTFAPCFPVTLTSEQ
jgi:hypothetical protein